jgi:sialic acid synthase SpsE
MKEMIHAAHEAGADLLKFQTYLADQRYDLQNNPKASAFTDLVSQWQFSRDQETELWEYARSLGATVFTSPFDADSVNFANDLESVAFKLAAFEVVNLKLVRAIAACGKPVVLSRGMVTLAELDTCLGILDDHSIPYIILHTISSYPLEKRNSHLRMIHSLRELYSCPIGHSDHTAGSEIPPLAVAAGANMIEKHFTVNPKLRESDNFFSVTSDDLRDIKFRVRQAESYLGLGDIVKVDTEDYMWDFRRPTT